MQNIPNPTCNDNKTIEAMLKVLPDGPEHEHQCGLLDAILAGEQPFRIQGQLINQNSGPTYILIYHRLHSAGHYASKGELPARESCRL